MFDHVAIPLNALIYKMTKTYTVDSKEILFTNTHFLKQKSFYDIAIKLIKFMESMTTPTITKPNLRKVTLYGNFLT